MPDLKARFDIIKMSILPRLIYRFHLIPQALTDQCPLLLHLSCLCFTLGDKMQQRCSSNQRAQDAWQVSASAIILRILPDLPAGGWELSGAKQSSLDGPKGDPSIPGCVSEWGPWPPELPTLRATVINHVLVSHPAFVVGRYAAFLGQQAVVLHYQK